METLFTYFIKVSVLVSLFYLSYHFLLKKETFFSKNRLFLLLGLVTSVLLPLVTITKTVWIEPEPIVFEKPVLIPNFSNEMNTNTIVTEDQKTEINWIFAVAGFYVLGMLFFLVKFILSSLSLYKVLHKNPVQKQNGFRFIDSRKVKTPFSFFNYIAFDSSSFSEDELQNIIAHEKVHCRQKHSFDVMFSQLFTIVFWLNPFVWLYKKAIQQNLEFIADNNAVRTSENRIGYQKTLLKVTLNPKELVLANSFYQPLIKKRIIMLNKNQSKNTNLLKYAFILPVLTLFLIQFQTKVVAQVKERTPQEFVYEGKQDEPALILSDTVLWVKDFSESYENGKSTEDFNKDHTEYFIGNASKKTAPLVIINGKQQENTYYPKDLSIKIQGEGSYKKYEPKQAIKKFGKKAKNGAYVIDAEKFSIVPVYEEDSSGNLKGHLNSKKEPLYIINGNIIPKEQANSAWNFEGAVIIKEYKEKEALEKFGEKGKDGAVVIEARDIKNLITKDKELISFLKTVKDYKLIDIYNRGGNLVYSLRPNEKLDEKKLNALEDGTYFYTFEKNSGEKVSGYLYKGDVATPEQRINSPEVQKHIKQAEQRAKEAEERINSPEFQKRIKAAEQRAKEAEERINSPEFQKRIKAAEQRAKEAEERESQNHIGISTISKNSSDSDIENIKSQMQKSGIQMKVSNLRRNKNGEIYKIKISLSESSGTNNNKKESKAEATFEKENEAIPDIFVGKRNGNLTVGDNYKESLYKNINTFKNDKE